MSGFERGLCSGNVLHVELCIQILQGGWGYDYYAFDRNLLHTLRPCRVFKEAYEVLWDFCEVLREGYQVFDEACKVLRETCKVLEEACKVLWEGYQVLGEACEVLGEACEVLEEACKVLREACEVLEEACKVLEEDCKVLGEDCQVLREGFQVLKGTNLWKSIWLTVCALLIERSRNHKLPIVASTIAQPPNRVNKECTYIFPNNIRYRYLII